MASETPGKRRSKDKSFPPAKSAKMDVMTQHNDDSTVNGESSYAQSQHITLHQLQGPEPAATSLIITPEDAERAVSTVKCEMTGDARDERNELDEPDLVEFDASEEIIVPKTKLCFIGWSETVSCCVLRLRNTMHHVAILRPEFVGDCTQHKECFKTMKDFKVKILESIRFAVNKGDVIFVDNTPSPHVLVKEPYMSTILPLLKKGKKVVDLTVYEDIGDADKAALEVQKTGASYLRLRILGFLDEKRFGTASAIAGGCDEIYEDIGSVLAVMCRKWRKFESSREATGYAAINQSMKGMQAAVLSEGQQVFSRALDKYNDDQNENDPPQSIFHRMLTDNLVSSKILGTREMNTAVEGMNKHQRKLYRTQLVAIYEGDGDWKGKAMELGVPMSTAYRWLREGDKTDGRGGRTFQKVQPIHVDFMVEKIEENARMTLKQIVEALHQEFGLRVSKPTVSRHLDAKAYTLKDVRFEPERANTIENKRKRKEFVTELLKLQSENLPIIFMDETNFNIHISRKEGWSKKGTRCSTVAAGSRGANVHVIGAISQLGLVHHEVRRGSFKKEDAAVWTTTCLRVAMARHGGPVAMIIDNAPCHSNLESVLKDELAGCRILRLSPYSPQLNPIEQVWSVLKSIVKSGLAEGMATLLGSQQPGLSMKEHRLRSLEGVVERSLPVITSVLCTNSIASIQRMVTPALNMEDLVW